MVRPGRFGPQIAYAYTVQFAVYPLSSSSAVATYESTYRPFTTVDTGRRPVSATSWPPLTMSPPPPNTRVPVGHTATADLRATESVLLAPDTTLLGAADAAVASATCSPADAAATATAATAARTPGL